MRASTKGSRKEAITFNEQNKYKNKIIPTVSQMVTAKGFIQQVTCHTRNTVKKTGTLQSACVSTQQKLKIYIAFQS